MPWLTLQEAQSVLGLSVRTLHRLIKKNVFESKKDKGLRIIFIEEDESPDLDRNKLQNKRSRNERSKTTASTKEILTEEALLRHLSETDKNLTKFNQECDAIVGAWHVLEKMISCEWERDRKLGVLYKILGSSIRRIHLSVRSIISQRRRLTKSDIGQLDKAYYDLVKVKNREATYSSDFDNAKYLNDLDIQIDHGEDPLEEALKHLDIILIHFSCHPQDA